MWSIGVVFLSVLLCKISFGVSANREVDGARPKVTDFKSGDVLPIVLNYFDFTTLWRVTEAMPWLSPYTSEIVRGRNLEFYICRTDPNYTQNYTSDPNVKDNGQIVSYKTVTILSVLKHLGSGFQNLTIDNGWRNLDQSDLNPAICQYTSNSLKTLKLYNIREESFVNMTVPFTKLEELGFGMYLQKNGPVILPMPLNQLFPQLRRVVMSFAEDIAFMDCEFPNLKHVIINNRGEKLDELGHFKGFVAKNSQVRSVILWDSPQDTLKLIHQHWPNLESLAIDVKRIGDHAVRFNHLKDLHLRCLYPLTSYPIEKISSSSLVSLRMVYVPSIADKWNTFIDKHNKLTHLIADIYEAESIPGLTELTTRMRNLVEMTVYSYKGFTVESIERIIQTHDKLLKLQLKPDHFLPFYRMAGMKLLQEKIGNEWNVEIYTINSGYAARTGYLLTRKTSELKN